MNVRLVSLLALSLATGLTAQKPADTKLTEAQQAHLARYGITCGLGKDFHRGRRDELLRRLPEGSVFVLRGMPDTGDYQRFHQDKTFWYLTGVSTPNAAIVLDKKTGRQILFLPRPGLALRQKESWDGEMWDTEDTWVPAITGFAEVEANRDLESVLRELLTEGGNLCTSLHPMVTLAGCFDRARPAQAHARRDRWDGRRGRRSTFRRKLEERLETRVRTVDKHLINMRRVKTPIEIEAMRRAARAGALGICEAIRSTRANLLEQELEAVVDLVTRQHGAEGPAYQAIIGSGPNSLILHYNGNRRRMRDGDVVLCDYGPQLNHYTTDITRSWPVSGKFSPAMIKLYDAVLKAQAAGIAKAKPGSTIMAIEQACTSSLMRAGYGALIRHGNCHLIGMEVHDPTIAARFMRRPLVPGVAFTIEPGVYDAKSKIGIRIEDTLVITKDGCEILSKDVPKDRANIEKLIAEPGVLDWLQKQKR